MNESAVYRFDSDRTTITGSVEETVVYPGCQRGIADANWAHQFVAGNGVDGFREDVPMIFCTACGQIRKLEYQP